MKQLKIQKQITRRTATLTTYVNEIGRIRLLSEKEEVDLATKAKAGDMKAREILIKANLRFVISCAKQYASSGPLEDCINAGNLGLCKAVDRFDPSRGFKFITYAVWWIRQSILQYLREEQETIRISNNTINERNKAVLYAQKETAKGNHIGTIEAARMLGMNTDRIVQAEQTKTVSFDAKLRDDDDESLYDSYGVDADFDNIKELSRKALQDKLKSLLTPVEYVVVTRTFGIGCNRVSVEILAKEKDCTKERVNQIRRRAFSTLKKHHEILTEFA